MRPRRGWGRRRRERPRAFARYACALDREQQAADVYAAIIGYYHLTRRALDARGREVAA